MSKLQNRQGHSHKPRQRGGKRQRPLSERLKAPLRRRSLLVRPQEIKELTRVAEEEPSYQNAIEIFHAGDPLYARMLEDIEGARREILIEMYMIESDHTGWRFARALAERARAGVTVRFIYDAVGSFNASEQLFTFMKQAGVELLEFRPIRPWARRFGVFGRNHRKILVVDHRLAYVGGMNVGDFWSASRRGKAAWRDTHVRLEGPAALDLSVLFVETWHRETGVLLRLPSRETRRQVAGEAKNLEGGVFIIGGRGRYRGKVRRIFQFEIEKCRRQLLVTNAYFIPGRRIRRALADAAARGVDVRILLPAKSDVTVADYAVRAYIEYYLSRGIRVHFYEASTLHAKVLISDERWATIGSSNFDNLSLKYNLESNAILFDAEAVGDLIAQFWKDLEGARELTLEAWRRRPLAAKWFERLASLFKPWL